jgi:Mrp family chromosome partitioning ATPase
MKSVDESFRFLCVRVQHGAVLPSFVAVGSAVRGDGTTYVACGLAQAFAEAGHETLLLDANPRDSNVARELHIPSVAKSTKPERIRKNLSVASLFGNDERLFEDEELQSTVARVRAQYAMTIVDVSAIPGSGAALQIARAADGLLIAVRLGRRRDPADQEMKLLIQAGGLLGDKTVSGIVPTRVVKRGASRNNVASSLGSSVMDLIGRAASRFQTAGR